jgi:hypothetical protein
MTDDQLTEHGRTIKRIIGKPNPNVKPPEGFVRQLEDADEKSAYAYAYEFGSAAWPPPLLFRVAKSNNPSPQTRLWMVGAIEGLGSKDVSFFASFLFDKNDSVAGYAAHAMERITKQDFGKHRALRKRLWSRKCPTAMERSQARLDTIATACSPNA